MWQMVQFNCSVVSNSLQPHGLQHARFLCPFPELTQTHVHQVSDATQPSHPLSSPSLPTFNLSQHQGLFQWVSSNQVAKVLELHLQHQSFQWISRTDFLWDWLVWSPHCPRDSQESSLALLFERINSSVLSLLYRYSLQNFLLYWGHNEKLNPLGKKPHEEKIQHLFFILWSRAGENQVTSCICLPPLIFLLATLHLPYHMYLHYTGIDKGTINFIL